MLNKEVIMVSYTEFNKSHTASVVALWRTVFPDRYISENSINRYLLNNPEFDSRGCHVALDEYVVVGFVLATTMIIPDYWYSKEMPGFIALLMIHPDYRKQGIGKGLLKKGEGYLREVGKTTVFVGYHTYIKDTLLSFPGVNAEWKEEFWFFNHFGYKPVGVSDHAKASLENFEMPESVLLKEKDAKENGILVGFLREEEEASFLRFLEKEKLTSWAFQFSKRFPQGSVVHDNVLVLRKKSEIVGFVGPFDISENGSASMGIGIAVASKCQGMGLGKILTFRLLDTVRERGAKRLVGTKTNPRHN